jgi:hypothetical protein
MKRTTFAVDGGGQYNPDTFLTRHPFIRSNAMRISRTRSALEGIESDLLLLLFQPDMKPFYKVER